MTHIDADYFDGISARRIAATITVADDLVIVTHDATSKQYERNSVRVQPQLLGAPRRIEFPDGSAAVVVDHAALESTFGISGNATLAHRLESHLGFVFVALIGVVIAVGLGYLYGVPWAAREIAQRLPIEIESQLGDASLKSLDSVIFKPSEMDAQTKTDISVAFARLRTAADLPDSVRLEFRQGGWIGANAFALPGGMVVVTDQLVGAMSEVPETAAVLAHELGHVHHRHSLQRLLQSSITALAAAAIYGDVASLTSVVVTVPTVLVQSAYSRDAEREADAFAFALLKQTGQSPRAFARAMAALEKAQIEAGTKSELPKKLGLSMPEETKKSSDRSETKAPRDDKRNDGVSYLSSHPDTAERIRAAEAAANEGSK